MHEEMIVYRAAALRPAQRAGSDPAHQRKNNDDEQDEAEAAAGVVAPAGAVRPSRQRTDQKQNQNDDENRTHGCDPSLVTSPNSISRWPKGSGSRGPLPRASLP